VLRYEQLSIAGCGVPIVSGLDLTFPEKGTAVLLGPSGCGKTTLLRCTIRTDEDEPDLSCTGRVILNGRDVRDPGYPVTELRQSVGLVMQRPVAFPGTAFDNVTFALKCTTKMTAVERNERALEALEHAGLEEQHHQTQARLLSGGQLKRLSIARSVALRPEVLLMDEPSNGLDPLAVTHLERLINRLSEDRLVVVITHDVGLTRRIADEVFFLWPGPGGSRLVEAGSAKDILDDPQRTETQLFVRAARLGAAGLDEMGVELCDEEAEECRPRTLNLTDTATYQDPGCHDDAPCSDQVPGPDATQQSPVPGCDPGLEVVHEPGPAAGRDATGCDRGDRGPGL
jgi:phosphate transport system ATP-binding protein